MLSRLPFRRVARSVLHQHAMTRGTVASGVAFAPSPPAELGNGECEWVQSTLPAWSQRPKGEADEFTKAAHTPLSSSLVGAFILPYEASETCSVSVRGLTGSSFVSARIGLAAGEVLVSPGGRPPLLIGNKPHLLQITLKNEQARCTYAANILSFSGETNTGQDTWLCEMESLQGRRKYPNINVLILCMIAHASNPQAQRKIGPPHNILVCYSGRC